MKKEVKTTQEKTTKKAPVAKTPVAPVVESQELLDAKSKLANPNLSGYRRNVILNKFPELG